MIFRSQKIAKRKQQIILPKKGKQASKILEEITQLKNEDVKWRDGKAFSLVFHVDKETHDLLQEVSNIYFSENALNPSAFPSIRTLSAEVVSIVKKLFNGKNKSAGSMTSGGTESIFLAVLSAREYMRAKKPRRIKKPEMIAPLTIHPAFDKACKYLNITIKHIPLEKDFRVNVAKLEQAINENTILIAASAPQYAHGVMDPIEDIAKIAFKKNILFHVDSCIGGFVLPFMEKLGHPIPKFDFRVKGVTSMSVDLHKYAYATKGSSVVLYSDSELRRKQFHIQTKWPGGIYASPGILGTRPAGPIAGAWTVLNYFGEDGYLKIVKTVIAIRDNLLEAIKKIEGIYVVGKPIMSVIALASDHHDIYKIGDEMSVRGWHLDKQQNPPTLHLTINYIHNEFYQAFLHDLEASVHKVDRLTWAGVSHKIQSTVMKGAARVLPMKALRKMNKAKKTLPKRNAAMYGMMGSLSTKGNVEDLILDLVDNLYDLPKK